ncbi:SLATT domain-containing protein [Clostridium arbusti]|uniref:SLATT domain-containing protein n=1 Tax=Clostridium arbusti TaxID=1137848 RepID=UPI000288DEEA|nr:SLATT domain-containing protein [Clostridium arbusti]
MEKEEKVNNDKDIECCNDGPKLLKELRRRVDVTYRTRIIATDRLRNQNTEYKKLNIYYSVLVTGLSILSIGEDSTSIGSVPISNIVLMFSILLTYFMFYTSEKNLQERAYKMEETFKSLDKLRNKIDSTLIYKEDLKEDLEEDSKKYLKEEDCKKLYQEYERILISIENHEQIDYQMYKLNNYKKEEIADNEKLLYEETKNKIRIHNIIASLEKFMKYSIPTIIAFILTIKILFK